MNYLLLVEVSGSLNTVNYYHLMVFYIFIFASLYIFLCSYSSGWFWLSVILFVYTLLLFVQALTEVLHKLSLLLLLFCNYQQASN